MITYRYDSECVQNLTRTIDMLDAISEEEFRLNGIDPSSLVRTWRDVNGMKLKDAVAEF